MLPVTLWNFDPEVLYQDRLSHYQNASKHRKVLYKQQIVLLAYDKIIVLTTIDASLHHFPGTALLTMPFFRRAKPLLVGLDLGICAIRLIELSCQNKHLPQLECYAWEPLPLDAINNDGIEDFDKVNAAAHRLWEKSGAQSHRVALGIPASMTMTALLPVIEPHHVGDDEQLQQLALAHAAQRLPYPLEQARVDFCLLAPSRANPNHSLFIVAARTEAIDDRLAIAESLGLKAITVDIDCYAAYTAWMRTQEPATTTAANGQINGLLRINAYGMQVALFADTRLIGAQQHYAHTHERSHIEKNQQAPTPRQLAHAANQLVRIALAAASVPALHQIVLAGASATMPGLATAVHQYTKTTTTIAAPFADMTLGATIDIGPIATQAPAYLTACGLALRGYGLDT